MKIIGITGPSGSGKSLLGKYLTSLGIPSIDADEVYHSMLIPPSPCLDALRSVFGDHIFNSDGTLDRSALAKIVFGDPKKLELLNATVLDKVLDKIRSMIGELEASGFDNVLVDGPTLIESGFYRECTTVISVLSDKDTRVARIMERDGISSEKAIERINAQKSDSFYIEHSHFVIYNNGSSEKFIEESKSLLKGLIL